jgi:hypothetical protein
MHLPDDGHKTGRYVKDEPYVYNIRYFYTFKWIYSSH